MRVVKQFCYSSIMIVLLAVTLHAHADVVPPEAWEAEQRFKQHPNVFDRTDQYCHHAKVGAACAIPGTAFAGGGQGTCERDYHHGKREIDLQCVPVNPINIERRIPDGPYRRDARDCAGSPVTPSEVDGHECTEPPVVTDRFCHGHQVNDACTAIFTVAGKPHSEDGRCEMTLDETKYYHYGYRIATRRVLQCLAKTPTPAIIYTPVSLGTKLQSW